MGWVEFDNCRIICADCADVLDEIGTVDALVTDPPYGIDRASSGNPGTGVVNGRMVERRFHQTKEWDRRPAPTCLITDLLKKTDHQIVFGGNYYSLPPTSCWLVWDKQNDGLSFADCEMAWTNLKGASRIFRYMWNGMMRKGVDPRGIHPTMKPMDLMKWCIQKLPDSVETILDPFMGSGTTGVAALGHRTTSRPPRSALRSQRNS
jgi:DNA modification methylase